MGPKAKETPFIHLLFAVRSKPEAFHSLCIPLMPEVTCQRRLRNYLPDPLTGVAKQQKWLHCFSSFLTLEESS